MNAREELFESLVDTWRRPAPGEAESAYALIDAHRDEVVLQIVEDMMREGLATTLTLLAGPEAAKEILDAYTPYDQH